MVEITIFIPTADNEGETFSPAHHLAFESFVTKRFGGLTKETKEVEGLWQDQGRIYRDQNLVYHVAIGSILDGGLLREVLSFAKEHYRQEAIFFRYLGIAEIFNG